MRKLFCYLTIAVFFSPALIARADTFSGTISFSDVSDPSNNFFTVSGAADQPTFSFSGSVGTTYTDNLTLTATQLSAADSNNVDELATSINFSGPDSADATFVGTGAVFTFSGVCCLLSTTWSQDTETIVFADGASLLVTLPDSGNLNFSPTTQRLTFTVLTDATNPGGPGGGGTVTPEPSSLLLLGTGILGFGAMLRRKHASSRTLFGTGLAGLWSAIRRLQPCYGGSMNLRRTGIRQMKIAFWVLGLISCGLWSSTEAMGSSLCQDVGSNLVSNCGFETGGFSGWTIGGNTLNPGANDFGVDAMDANSGNDGAYVGQDFIDGGKTPVDLSQALSTTAGDMYSITFYLKQDTAPSPGFVHAFTASWGGSTVLALTPDRAAPGVVGSFEEYSFTELATGSNTVLQFAFEDDDNNWSFDDVSVAEMPTMAPTPTPEPNSLILLGTGLLGVAATARHRFALWNT